MDITPAIVVSLVSMLMAPNRVLERSGWPIMPTMMMQPLIGPGFPPHWTPSA
jgi:hypothetical protein